MTSATVDAFPASGDEPSVAWPAGEIMRDISRGGLTGAIVGLVALGIGGRLVMRLAALLVPEATGLTTENGNRIGDITQDGTAFLVLGGILVGLLAGTIWVIVSPWIPGRGLGRAILTMPVAVALGAAGLVDGANPDFFVLRHDPRVVASLIGLVALSGFLFAIVDDWLDGHLPHARRGMRPIGLATPIYVLLTVIGSVVIAPMVVFAYLSSKDAPTVLMGIALGAVAATTILWWSDRLLGRPVRSPRLMAAGRITLLVAVGLGAATVLPEIVDALGA
jgi:hypothetical protein